MIIDYDLNVYQLDDDDDKWYIQVFSMNEAGGYREATDPIALTDDEVLSLKLGTGYFDEQDSWYGLSAFIATYGKDISDRLLDVFNMLPKRQGE